MGLDQSNEVTMDDMRWAQIGWGNVGHKVEKDELKLNEMVWVGEISLAGVRWCDEIGSGGIMGMVLLYDLAS